MAGDLPAVWLITGMSGAGKATALKALESRGVSCVDNLPPSLAGALVVDSPADGPVAAVVDARHGDALVGFLPPPGVRVLFLDARDEVLVLRQAESARPHPCVAAGAGRPAIDAERGLLVDLRAAADAVLDTSDTTCAELARRVIETIRPDVPDRQLICTVSSFGFKHGPLLESDWVVDARFLRNPFWEPELRPLTGLDEAVRAYVLDQPAARELVERLTDLLGWAAERTAAHGRSRLHVAIACTGGRHRSVVLACALGERLGATGLSVVVRHRDVDRPAEPPSFAAE
jgi:RNase adapter protein RapZ